MIEIEYWYLSKKQGGWTKACAYFTNLDKAIRFMYMCKRNKNMRLGDWTCDDPWDTEEIERRIK